MLIKVQIEKLPRFGNSCGIVVVYIKILLSLEFFYRRKFAFCNVEAYEMDSKYFTLIKYMYMNVYGNKTHLIKYKTRFKDLFFLEYYEVLSCSLRFYGRKYFIHYLGKFYSSS